jgi:hypothetical protein
LRAVAPLKKKKNKKKKKKKKKKEKKTMMKKKKKKKKKTCQYRHMAEAAEPRLALRKSPWLCGEEFL